MHIGHTAVEFRFAARVKHVNLDPVIIGAEPDGPENRCDPGLFKVHFCALHLRRPNLDKGRLLGRRDSVAGDIGVDLVAYADIAAVGVIQVLRQVRQEFQTETLHISQRAIEFDAVVDMPLAQVDFLAAVAAGHIVVGLRQRLDRIGVGVDGDPVMPRIIQPISGITTAILARAAWRRADSQMHTPARTHEILHDLHPGLACADNQNVPLRQLRRIAVINRMHLHDGRVQRAGIGRFDRLVVAACGNHHLIAGPGADAGFHNIAALRQLCDPGHSDMFVQRRLERGGKGIEIIGDLVAQHKAIGIGAAEFLVIVETRQATLPVRRDKAKAVPTVHAPGMEFLVTLEDDAFDAFALQLTGHGQACLTAADNRNRDMGNMGICHGFGPFHVIDRQVTRASVWPSKSTARRLIRSSCSIADEQAKPYLRSTRFEARSIAMRARCRKSVSG